MGIICILLIYPYHANFIPSSRGDTLEKEEQGLADGITHNALFNEEEFGSIAVFPILICIFGVRSSHFGPGHL